MRDPALEARVRQAQASRDDFARVEPEDLSWDGDGSMRVVWSDGTEAVYSRALLRAVCPCAECRGTHTGKPKAFNIISSDKLAGAQRQTVVEAVEPVGNYAVCFTWGDGHRDGIYSWPYLRALAPGEGD